MIVKDKNGDKVSINPRHFVKAIPKHNATGCIIFLTIEGMEKTVYSSQSIEEIDAAMFPAPARVQHNKK